MIKKLQIKFFIINMLIVSVVLSIMLGYVLHTSELQFQDSCQTALEAELNIGKPGKRPFVRRMDIDTDRVSFTVRKEQGEWRILTPWIEIEDEDLNALIQKALQELTENGFWKEDGIAYSKQDNKIAFVNVESEYQRFLANKNTWYQVYFGAFLVFTIISLFLSYWAIAPAKRAWQNQKSFISDASHELKTPLTVIMANLDIALKNPEESKWVSVARGEAEYMKKLLDSLLFLARNDENKMLSKQDIVSVSELAEELTLAFEAIAFEKSLNLESEVTPFLFVKGDGDLLRQLLSILLENAIKYTPKNNSIYLRLRSKQEKIIFSLRNTGTFLAPDRMNHIFDRFFRVDEARSKGGYGLGLSIAKKITTLHGGEIKVKSTEEEGTTFTVVLNKAVRS